MMQKQHVQSIREALLRQQEMHKKQKQHKTVVVGQKPKDSIINNSNYDLQFVYKCFDDEERESLIACTPTQAMKLDGPFDFDDFKQATQSAAFPPMFQQLVQDAIHHELHPPKIPAYSLEAFSGTLRPNQVAALEFSLSRPHALLALETGLGKTATSYAYMATLWPNLKNDRILVVCPAHLRPNWLEEGKRFLHASYQKQIAVIQEAKTAPKIVDCSDIKIIIVSYTMLESVKTLLLKNQQHYQLIVCDEAHYMQSSKSRCSVALFALRKHTDHMLLLSATPSATCTSMWNLLRMLNPVVFADFFHYKNPNIPWPHSTSTFYFAERYVQPEKVYTKGGALQWAFKRSVRRQELHALTRKYILYQCKRDILTELPPLCFEQLVVGSATLEQKIAFQATMERIVDIEQKKGHVFAEALFMEQVRETARQKLPFVLQYIHDLLKKSDTKFIVWAYHKVVMQTISDDLSSKGITHILVNGDTPKKQRASLFEKLQKDPETKIAVMSLEACGTGLNFAFIQLSLYAELTFRYKAHVQSEGRCYRIGQTGETIARYLVLENSTDDIVWKSMQRKRDNESMILNNEHSQLTFEKIIAFQEQLPDLWNDAQQQQEQEEEENEENEEQHNISPKRQKTSCVQ